MIRSNASMKPLQNAVPGAVAELLRAAPLSPGKVAFAWKTAVGAAVQQATVVRLEGRVLLVDTTSAQWAREVMRSSPVILSRLQRLLGAETVSKIEARPPASEIKIPRRKRAGQPHGGHDDRSGS
jgi:predicted nucleic acid-binding Zn ribbon protein